MPLYLPPQATRATRVAVGSAARSTQSPIVSETTLPSDPSLLRSGILNESRLLVTPHGASVDPTGTGELSYVSVSEVNAIGVASEHRVVVTDAGNNTHFLLGRNSDRRSDTANKVLNITSQSTGNTPTGIQSETEQTVGLHSSHQGDSNNFVSSVGPTQEQVAEANQAYLDSINAFQYDSALGIGQPVYQPPTGGAPTQPLQTVEDPGVDPYWSYLDPYTQPTVGTNTQNAGGFNGSGGYGF